MLDDEPTTKKFTESLEQKKFVLGIDVGGTTIKYQLFENQNGTLVEDDGFKSVKNTHTGVNEHTSQIANVILAATRYAVANGGIVDLVGVGSPGRFDEHGRIKPQTNTNMEKDGSTDFDNLNLGKEYIDGVKRLLEFVKATPTERLINAEEQRKTPRFAQEVPSNIELTREIIDASNKNLQQLITNKSIVVKNDANAMLSGMVGELLAEHRQANLVNSEGYHIHPTDFKKTQFALLGLGTGVGHAIGEIDENGTLNFITDGHASKLMIKVDEEDRPQLEKAKKYIAEHNPAHQIIEKDGMVRAEDLFKAPMVNGMAGLENGKDMDAAENDEHKAALAFAGKYMARTIAAIASGENEDITGQGWDEKAKAQAANTTLYILGGTLGMSDDGIKIQGYAVKELEKLTEEAHDQGDTAFADKLENIQIAQYKGPVVASKGAAEMALQEISRGVGR